VRKLILKELNEISAKKVASSAFWNGEIFCKYFAPDFTMEYPIAPPGMPNYYNTWEAERCFEWLNRSVRSWEVQLEEFYSTPDPNQFWAIGHCGGDVFWGEHDGKVWTKYLLKIEFTNQKVSHIRLYWDPFELLKAAGKKPAAQLFEDLDNPKIDEYLKNHPEMLKPPAGEGIPGDCDFAAVRKRLQTNLNQFICGVEREKYRGLEIRGKGYRNGTWFNFSEDVEKAKAIEEEANPVLAARVHAWVKASSPWMYRDPRGRIYPTDDPKVFFADMNCHGPGCLLGNGCDVGHYRQAYLLYLRFDDAGCLVTYDEILNPSNGLNSVAKDIPNFPYYH
jgi:ketosteroid isomerase-like protein